MYLEINSTRPRYCALRFTELNVHRFHHRPGLNKTAPVSLMLTEAVFRICQYILLFLVNLGASSCKCIRTFYVCLFYQWPNYNLYHEPFLAFHNVSVQILQRIIFWSLHTCIDVSMDGTHFEYLFASIPSSAQVTGYHLQKPDGKCFH